MRIITIAYERPTICSRKKNHNSSLPSQPLTTTPKSPNARALTVRTPQILPRERRIKPYPRARKKKKKKTPARLKAPALSSRP